MSFRAERGISPFADFPLPLERGRLRGGHRGMLTVCYYRLPLFAGREVAAVLQDRILAGRAEVPRVIVARYPVHVHVPAGVDAAASAVRSGSLQLGYRLARAGGGRRLSRGSCIPIAVGGCTRVLADETAQIQRIIARLRHRTGGVAGGDGSAGFVLAHQSADEWSAGVGDKLARHVCCRVACGVGRDDGRAVDADQPAGGAAPQLLV